MPRDCAFCDQRATTKEDAFPLWIGKLLLRGRKQKMTLDLVTTGYINDRRRRTTKGIAVPVGIVCKPCNNGWMSNLESEVRAFASPMIQFGQETALDVRRQTVMAAWALKTSMVLEFARPAETIVYSYFTSIERQQIREMLLPPENALVWLGRQESHAPGCRSVSGVLATQRDGKEIAKGHVSTLWFGQLVVQVLAHRPGETLGIKTGPWNWDMTLAQVWPPSPPEIIWPPLPMTLEAFGALANRFATSPMPKNRPDRVNGSL